MECFGLQGCPAWVGEGMSKRDVLEVTGNACSVPVVGSVLVQVLNVVDWSGVLWPSWPIMGCCQHLATSGDGRPPITVDGGGKGCPQASYSAEVENR